MATVTAPIMTDATGQSIDSKLNSLLGKMDNLAAAFQPNASGIVYSNTTSGLTGDDVQEAIDEMAADVSEIKQSLSDLEEHEYIVTRWVTFSYFNASQLEGTYSVPTVPSGYSVRLLGCMPTFANNAMGAKFSGKFLSSTGNKLRALGSGFVSGDSESFLVLFLVYKS